jgi:hypothetical protein
VEGLDQYGGTLVFLVAGGWVVWLIVGTLINRQRAASVSRWVYREVRPHGGKLAIRWLTLAAFELTVGEARKPFRQLTLVGFLESREMPFVWLWNRLSRRGDLLVARAELRRLPRWGLEAYRAHSVVADDARRAAQAAGWAPQQAADGLWRANGGGAAAELSDRLIASLGPYAARVERLAVRREAPQLIVVLSLRGLSPDRASPLGRWLADLADLAAAEE